MVDNEDLKDTKLLFGKDETWWNQLLCLKVLLWTQPCETSSGGRCTESAQLCGSAAPAASSHDQWAVPELKKFGGVDLFYHFLGASVQTHSSLGQMIPSFCCVFGASRLHECSAENQQRGHPSVSVWLASRLPTRRRLPRWHENHVHSCTAPSTSQNCFVSSN